MEYKYRTETGRLVLTLGFSDNPFNPHVWPDALVTQPPTRFVVHSCPSFPSQIKRSCGQEGEKSNGTNSWSDNHTCLAFLRKTGVSIGLGSVIGLVSLGSILSKWGGSRAVQKSSEISDSGRQAVTERTFVSSADRLRDAHAHKFDVFFIQTFIHKFWRGQTKVKGKVLAWTDDVGRELNVLGRCWDGRLKGEKYK